MEDQQITDASTADEEDAGLQRGVSIYEARGRAPDDKPGPHTIHTATIETVDNDQAPSLLGVLPPS